MSTHPMTRHWRKDAGPRVEGSRPLDSAKVQAPCIVRHPSGGFRLFYTAIGPAKPFAACQGYILSAVSGDGLIFRKEPGIRMAPRPELPYLSLRVLAPTITPCGDGRWRMYFEARGSADQPTVICSSVSVNMLDWELEDGIRLQRPGGVGGPRYQPLAAGGGRIYCFESEFDAGGIAGGQRIAQSVVSAVTTDGLHFQFEPGCRMRDRQGAYDNAGITAAEVLAPGIAGAPWTMVYSAWQDVPPGTVVPVHPSHDATAVESGRSADFAAASIAADMAGYRSRIFVAHSTDALLWAPGTCIIEGNGYCGDGLDAVHAEDMSLIEIGDGLYRMYYAACDRHGNWRIASATSFDEEEEDANST
jgi:hypothetical protein